jgi:succinate dehydrogenase/fumarate reductase flavoprotein subunit
MELNPKVPSGPIEQRWDRHRFEMKSVNQFNKRKHTALERQIRAGHIKMYPRTEMLDLVVVDRQARGIVARNLLTGRIESYVADAVVLATGGYVSAWKYAGDQRKRALHKEPLKFEYVASSQRSCK